MNKIAKKFKFEFDGGTLVRDRFVTMVLDMRDKYFFANGWMRHLHYMKQESKASLDVDVALREQLAKDPHLVNFDVRLCIGDELGAAEKGEAQLLSIDVEHHRLVRWVRHETSDETGKDERRSSALLTVLEQQMDGDSDDDVESLNKSSMAPSHDRLRCDLGSIKKVVRHEDGGRALTLLFAVSEDDDASSESASERRPSLSKRGRPISKAAAAQALETVSESKQRES